MDKPLTLADAIAALDAHYAKRDAAREAAASTAAASAAAIQTALQTPADPPLESMTTTQKLELGLRQSQPARGAANNPSPEQLKHNQEMDARIATGNHGLSDNQMKLYQGLRESSPSRGPRPAA
jgi:hypothetical protein